MAGIKWNKGRPPETQRDKRLLFIASPTNVNYESGVDNRPDICVGHFHAVGDPYPVVARFPSMSANERRSLNVLYWAEIDLPPGVTLRALTDEDLKG